MKHIDNCDVYRPARGGDCTGNGITARMSFLSVIIGVPYLTIENDGKTYWDCPDEEAIEDYVIKNGLDPRKVVFLCDKRNNPIYTPYLKPLDSVYGVSPEGKLCGPCAGGNYVLFRDNDGLERLVRVHDRYDTQQAWDGLSI